MRSKDIKAINEEDKIFMLGIHRAFHIKVRKMVHAVAAGRNKSIEEDAYQNTFERLCPKVDTLRKLTPGRLNSYILKAARFSTLDLLEKEERRRYYNIDELEEELAADEDSVEDIVIRHEEIERMHELISELSERDQDLLSYRYILGLSYAEISEIMGIKEASLPQYVKLAKNRLRKKTGGERR